MTTEALDLLEQLSNPTRIKQAAQERDRPQDRFPASHFRADILGKGADLELTTRTPQGSQFSQTGVWLSIDVKEILAGRGELGVQKLFVRVPGPRQDGRQPEANDRSELGQMMLSAVKSDSSIKSIRDLPGRKNVEFHEATDKYMGRQRNDQTGEWGDREFTTWFYRLSFGKGSNGATPLPAPAKPSEAAVARALEMIRDAGEGGLKETEFNIAISKESAKGKGDALAPKYLAEGTFVSDNQDKVLRDGANLVWVAG